MPSLLSLAPLVTVLHHPQLLLHPTVQPVYIQRPTLGSGAAPSHLVSSDLGHLLPSSVSAAGLVSPSPREHGGHGRTPAPATCLSAQALCSPTPTVNCPRSELRQPSSLSPTSLIFPLHLDHFHQRTNCSHCLSSKKKIALALPSLQLPPILKHIVGLHRLSSSLSDSLLNSLQTGLFLHLAT